jgi:hypothetical protein
MYDNILLHDNPSQAGRMSKDIGNWQSTDGGTDKQESGESEIGMDLSYYYRSAEWDILNISVGRHEIIYQGCCGLKVNLYDMRPRATPPVLDLRGHHICVQPTA